MTEPPEQLAVLVDRAARGVALRPAEGQALREAVQRLHDQVNAAEARAEDWRLAARRSMSIGLAAEKRAQAAKARIAGSTPEPTP